MDDIFKIIEFTKLLLVSVSIILFIIILNYINNRFFSNKKLDELLKEENVYIISNNYCRCYNIQLCEINLELKCSLCRINNIIDFEDPNHIYKFIKNIPNNINMIIQTEGGECEEANYFAYILKQRKIRIKSYIPNYALSAGSFIAITGDEIFMNWYSTMGPIDTQIDFSTIEDEDSEDETFPAKYVAKIKKKDNALVKLKAREAECYHYDDKFIIKSMFKRDKSKKIIKNLLETKHSHNMRFGPKDLRKFGLNINTNMPPKIQLIFDIFIKQCNGKF